MDNVFHNSCLGSNANGHPCVFFAPSSIPLLTRKNQRQQHYHIHKWFFEPDFGEHIKIPWYTSNSSIIDFAKQKWG